MAYAAAICVSLVVLFLAGIVLLLSRSWGAKTDPSHLNLSSVRDAMLEKHGWTLERADRAQREYVRFLVLLQKMPAFMLVPWLDADGRDDLDQFWHQHILDTLKYATDCNALFGRMIHHNPHLQRGSEQENDAVAKTRRLYTRTFSSGMFGSDADPADFSGCSACGAEASGHHASHTDHAGHSGGDGGHGHSCGGHSCGGHGCGGH
jgi:hypothetical protein